MTLTRFPYTPAFTITRPKADGFASFHSAFWHNLFGRPKSHGCINMSPADARWLFNWAGPPLPEGWHGAYPDEDTPGTLVRIRGETPTG